MVPVIAIALFATVVEYFAEHPLELAMWVGGFVVVLYLAYLIFIKRT